MDETHFPRGAIRAAVARQAQLMEADGTLVSGVASTAPGSEAHLPKSDFRRIKRKRDVIPRPVRRDAPPIA